MSEDGERIDMDGVVVAWDGTLGTILAGGLLVSFNFFQLKVQGFRNAPKIGDRICFTARRRIQVDYHIDDIRLVAPQEPRGADAIKYLVLKSQNKICTENQEGVVESYDAEKGYGFIVCEGDEKALVHVTALRASGIKNGLVAGDRISCELLRRPKGLQVFRVLEILTPQ